MPHTSVSSLESHRPSRSSPRTTPICGCLSVQEEPAQLVGSLCIHPAQCGRYTAGQRLREVTGFASKDTAKEEQMQVQRRGSHLCHTVLLLEQWVSSRWDGAVRLSPLLDTHTET